MNRRTLANYINFTLPISEEPMTLSDHDEYVLSDPYPDPRIIEENEGWDMAINLPAEID